LRAEKSADQQRQLWQVTLSSIGDAVIATDTEGRITFMNPVAETHIGLAPGDCLGRPLEEVFVILDEESGALVENPVQRVLKSGGVVSLADHTVLVRPDGTQLPIDDSGAPIRDAAGNLLGVILVFHEVAESRRLQRELLKHTDSLRDADRRKDEFLAVLAHELRNPLAPLRNGLQILRREAERETSADRVLAMMERQLSHLVRLVDDLMDLRRVTHGIIDLRMAPVHIRDVLMRSLEGVGPDLQARGHHVQVDLPQHDIVVMGDGHRLTQVFTNLLANSIKYSDDGARITVNARACGGEVAVDVTDTGVGIPADQLTRVFEMFSQVRTHQRRAEGGLGIGLAVARTLVQQHGGTIDVHSAGPGLGTTFTVRLPTTEAHEDQPNAVGAHARLVASGGGIKIVVADDNADAAESLRMLLEAIGHEVRVARNGSEAVEITRLFAPDLIFMDVGMPEMDGLEATRRIRSESNGDTPIIVALTGWGQSHDRERTRRAGANRHVVKPMSPEELEQIFALAAVRHDP
jgi:PAS domain S-box-containing protein